MPGTERLQRNCLPAMLKRFILSILVLAWPLAAYAAPDAQTKAKSALSGACSGDLATFCPDADPAGKDV